MAFEISTSKGVFQIKLNGFLVHRKKIGFASGSRCSVLVIKFLSLARYLGWFQGCLE